MGRNAIIAIIVIVAACIIAAGAYIAFSGGNDKPDDNNYVSDDTTGRLKVFGNANNDDYLNEKDIDYLKKIIAGTAARTQFADANQDGKVDNDDVQFVKDVLDGKQNKVWISQVYNKETQIVDCKYPLEKIAVAGYETITVIKSIGAAGKIVALTGASGDSFNEQFYSDVYNLPKCGPDIWRMDVEKLSDYKVDAIVSMDAKSYIENYETFEKAGIDVVRIEAAHAMNSLSGIVTIGFLLGCTEKANELMEFFDGITENIKKKVGTVSDADKKTGLFLTMKYYVEGPSALSEYTGTMAIAGAKTLADVYPEEWGTKARLTFKPGDDWLLKDKYQADFICLSNALGLTKMTKQQIQDKWDDCGQYMSKMNAFPNGYFILNSTLSPVLRIAFMATVMYPEIMGANYAYDCVQQYYDKFITNVKNFDAKNDATWIITSYTVSDSEILDTAVIDTAELKVYGNINGDRFLDEKDAAIIDKLVERGRTAKDFPLADANQDNVLNADDAKLVRDVAAGKPAVIWHVNYHDFNGDGTMDEELVSTKFPITSAISTGSTNTLVLEMMLGLADNIKGATYGNTNDAKLLGKTMLNTDRVERIGTSTMKIPFEDGKAGSTNIIAEKNVTAVIADWNRSYLTNEADFEKSNIDVVRVAAAAIDRETTTHTYMLLGLLFQKSERADQLLTLCMDVYDYVENSVKNSEKPKAVASSSNGSISSITSDYTQSVLTAGAEFPLGSIDFAGSSGLAIVEHPEVYLIDFPYLFHIRNQVSYDQSPESLQDAWDTATAPFKDWKYADSGQYVVCAIMPMCLRVAYVATVLHPDTVSIEKVNEFHQKLVDDFFDCKDHFNVSEMKFVLTPEEYAKA